jgi:formate dehydrogenase accessory protein FdhE
VAKGFFQKWFGGQTTPPAHLAGPLGDLAKLASDRPSLQDSCSVLQSLLLELFSELPADAPPLIPTELAQAKGAAGTPLLRDVPLGLDEASFRRRWLAVCAALQQPETELLADAVSKKTLEPMALLSDVLAGRLESVAIKAEALDVDAGQLATVLRLTALPLLAKFADALAERRMGVRWDYGYCPTCGSWPLLAESRGLEQLRFLRCGLCATAWEGSRFRCLFCANEDHRSLGYFHVEGEEDRCRAAICDECHGYVKVISTLSGLSAPQLLVTDLATLHLDLVAADRGFFVPTTDV